MLRINVTARSFSQGALMERRDDDDNARNNRRLDGGPPCYRCNATTSIHRRIDDPATSKSYDLFECTVCGNHTWSPVTTARPPSSGSE